VGGGRGRTVSLREALRLVVITDARIARPRSVEDVVAAALDAGARAVQLRAKDASPHAQLTIAKRLLALTRPAGALLFVNDRFDVALAAGADGVHLGPADLPVEAVRRASPRDFLVGYSSDDPDEARSAAAAGADYLGCGAVWGTRTKEVGEEAIGLERLDEVARAVAIPVVAIGGITAARAKAVAGTRATGVAVVSAVMAAADPGVAVRALLRPFLER
jgi:thiamine-phosphate pyrophosphorylase